jgi:hypothetical protein
MPRIGRLHRPCCQRYSSGRSTFLGPTHHPVLDGFERRSTKSIQVRRQHVAVDNLPRVAQPSLWKSLIPSFLRRRHEPPKTRASRGSNPATFFIIIFTLIGSQAIQFIKLRHNTNTRTRHAERKIALLKEVIKRVQQGEDVDVEGLLGTGNKGIEKDWEEG